MDKETIISQIKHFANLCAARGKRLTFCALVPDMEHYEHTSYTLQVYAPWFENQPRSDIFDTLVPLLFEATSVEVREKIYRIAIYDVKGDIHCRFDDLIIENQIGFNPHLVRFAEI